MKIVAGLGNPGRQYERTRHNIGFRVVDELARRWKLTFRHSLSLALLSCSHERVVLLKPQSYMNRSGDVIAPYMRKKGVGAEGLIVVVDDLSLEPGQLRIRPNGSAGGHNGLKSIIANLGTDEFIRLRVGIGRQCAKDGVVDYVLSPARSGEDQVLQAAIGRAADAVELLLAVGVDKAMNTCNGLVAKTVSEEELKN